MWFFISLLSGHILRIKILINLKSMHITDSTFNLGNFMYWSYLCHVLKQIASTAAQGVILRWKWEKEEGYIWKESLGSSQYGLQ